jgi:nickel-dependent lactate racemase
MRISNSFSEGEIHVLEFILQTLLRGGKPSTAVRNKDFASLYRKVVSMRHRVEEKKSSGEEVSSVGTIGAEDDDALSQVG